MNDRPSLIEPTQTQQPTTLAPSRSGEMLLTWLFRLVTALLLLVTLGRIIWHFSERSTFDDSFMFVRYADHAIRYGCLCWNVGEAPTYGLTGPAFLAIVIPIRLLTPDSPAATVVLSSAFCALLFLTLLVILLRRYVSVTARTRRMVMLLTALALATGSYSLCNHFSSGMDTMFALATMTAMLIGYRKNESNPSRGVTVVLGIATGLIFFVRPDLLIYGMGIPGMAFLAARERGTRIRMATIVGVGAITLGIELLLTNAYFGLPLPLPFYAKALQAYTGYIRVYYRYVPYEQFAWLLYQYSPLFAVAIPSFIYLLRRHGLRIFTPVELGIGAATLVFITYYLFFVLQIMPQEARFYYPTVPALFLLAARCVVLLWEVNAPPVRWAAALRARIVEIGERREKLIRVSAAALVVVVIVGGVLFRGALAGSVARMHTIGEFDVQSYYLSYLHDYWYRLDEISRLPDDLVLGTTEVGVPAALNPGKKIIDIAGLNNTEIARHGFNAALILRLYTPDIFYLPHPHYTEMNREIQNDPMFKTRYEFFSAGELGAVMGMAIRRDSKYYGTLRRIALEGPAPGAADMPPSDR